METIDILCETSRFNVSRPGAHFINPGCFGEDFAAWLREQLAAKGVHVTEPDQEDWGWYIEAAAADGTYFLGISGYARDNAQSPDDGEWRIIVQRHRSFTDKLKGKNKLHADDATVLLIEQVLRSDPSFANVRRDEA